VKESRVCGEGEVSFCDTDSRVVCEGRVSSWERMEFVRESNVRERESRVCVESEVCVGDGRLYSDV